MVSIVRLTTREAVAVALEQVAAHWRAGHIIGMSFHVEPSGTARISVIYAPDVDPDIIPIVGVSEEDDER